MDPNQINWSKIWRDGVIFFAGHANKATSWDGVAARWNNIHTSNDYGPKVLERIRLEPDWTVLDVGCGAGLLTVPLAKKCKHVTALDISGEMLKFLSQNATKENANNITCIHKEFGKAIIGKDVEKHDVVVASRSMGWELNLKKYLQNMDTAAKKRAYVIWGAGDRPFDIGMYEAIGRPYKETRIYTVLYNLLYQLGIRANIEIFECQPLGTTYKTIEEGFFELCKRFERRNDKQELSDEEKTRLEAYLRKTLKKTSEGTYSFTENKPQLQALIWWEKTQTLN